MNIKKIFIEETDNTFIQFFRYCFVGGLAMLVDTGSLIFLVEKIGMGEIIATIIGFFLGLATNYVLSTFWIFKNSKITNRIAEFLAFAIIGVIGLGISIGIISLFSNVIAPMRPIKFITPQRYYILGKIVATGVVFIWNFCARKFIIFNKNNA